MKELFLGIAAQMASQELSEEQAIAKIKSLQLDERVWQQIVERLPTYQEQPAMALSIGTLLYDWAKEKLDEPRRLEAMLWKGWGALLVSEFATANSCFTSVRDYYKEHHPERLSHCYMLYADAYVAIGRFSRALEYYQDALQCGERGSARVEVLCKMAKVHRRSGNAEEAISHYRQALDLSGVAADEPPMEITKALLDIFRMEQPDAQKIKNFEEITAFFEKMGAKRSHALTLAEMGRFIATQGYREKAIECLEKARSLLEGAPVFREKSDIITHLGKLYQETGKFLEAIKCFELSRKILRECEEAEKQRPGRSPAPPQSLDAILPQPQPFKAAPSYAAQATPPSPPQSLDAALPQPLKVAPSLPAKATPLSPTQPGATPQAQPLKAAPSRPQRVPSQPSPQAPSMPVEGETTGKARIEENWQPELEDEGEILSYKKMLREAQEKHDVERECSLLHTMGNLYLGQGKLDQAMQCWHESLALAQQQQNMEALYQNYFRLGLLSIKRGDLEGARNALVHGIGILEDMRDYFTTFSVEFIEEHVEIFHQVILSCVKMGNMASALHFLEQMHRWLFLGRVHDRVLLSRSAVSEDLQKEYQQALERLQLIYRNVQDQPSHNVWESAVRTTWKSIRQYQEKLDALRTQFEVFDPEWEKLFGKRFRFDPADLQSKLQQGTVLLEFLPTGEETLIFVIDSRQIDVIFIKELDDPKLRQLSEPFEQLENFTRLWQDWCIERKMGTPQTQQKLKGDLAKFPWKTLWEVPQAWKSALDRTTQELSDIILSRLLPVLEELQADRLVLIPCHVFSLFPLHLLVLPNPQDTLYLKDGYEIVYAPSATLFLECQKCQPQEKKHLLLVGYPGQNLHFFAEELDRIPHIWRGEISTQLYEKATPEKISEKMREASHVHLGAHTISTFPDPINSLLYLVDEESHDVFQLRIPHIISQFHLNAEVVSLSANDREFQYSKAGRGMGLIEAFLYTGAKAVVASMWPLPDIVVFLLMEGFYQGLSQGLLPWMALYEAQNELRNMTIKDLYDRMAVQQKLLPESRNQWLKQVCAFLSREAGLSGEDRQTASAILSAFRDPVTADILKTGMQLPDFFPGLEGKSAIKEPGDPTGRPFEHPFYWGGMVCIGMGLTEKTVSKVEDPHSVSVYIEDLGLLQDGQATAKDIEDALAALTDEGLKSCESVEKTARENPLIQESLAAKKAKQKRQYFKIRCPHCNAKIRCAMVSEGGGVARCPHCEKKIRIPPRPSPFDDIKIPAVCPHCGENIHCFLPMAGRRATCACCHKKVRIPKRELLLAEIASSDLNSRIVLLDQ